MSYLRDWRGYNEALVKMGLILLDLDFVAGPENLKLWTRAKKAPDTVIQSHLSS